MTSFKYLVLLAFTFLLAAPSAAQAQPASFVDLGIIGTPGTFTFDTVGSTNDTAGGNLDTEIALFDVSGVLLDTDDDGLGFPFSVVTQPLASGQFFIAISEFNSIWADGFVNTGSQFEAGELGTAVLNINGVTAGSLAIGEAAGFEEQAFFRVEVSAVPEPGSVSLLALAGLAAFVRRRR